MPTHTGRWEPTPFQANLEEIVDLLISDFGWTLQDITGDNSDRTSDPDH
jgi:hypothetical protein